MNLWVWLINVWTNTMFSKCWTLLRFIFCQETLFSEGDSDFLELFWKFGDNLTVLIWWNVTVMILCRAMWYYGWWWSICGTKDKQISFFITWWLSPNHFKCVSWFKKNFEDCRMVCSLSGCFYRRLTIRTISVLSIFYLLYIYCIYTVLCIFQKQKFGCVCD